LLPLRLSLGTASVFILRRYADKCVMMVPSTNSTHNCCALPEVDACFGRMQACIRHNKISFPHPSGWTRKAGSSFPHDPDIYLPFALSFLFTRYSKMYETIVNRTSAWLRRWVPGTPLVGPQRPESANKQKIERLGAFQSALL
jgi:hypothetical protein